MRSLDTAEMAFRSQLVENTGRLVRTPALAVPQKIGMIQKAAQENQRRLDLLKDARPRTTGEDLSRLERWITVRTMANDYLSATEKWVNGRQAEAPLPEFPT